MEIAAKTHAARCQPAAAARKHVRQHVRATLVQRWRRRPLDVLSAAATEQVDTKKPNFTNANFPTDSEGHTYHLGTKKGEVANRILSVGSIERAKALSRLLDPHRVFQKMSSRGFLTITGRYQDVPVSIVSTQMGMPNMDFVIRENRAVVDGQMAVVRFGTCGALQPPGKLGSLIVASQGSVCIRRDPDAFTLENGHSPYTFNLPVPADAELSVLVEEEAIKAVGRDDVVTGLNATADSFYSSQGRLAQFFDDRNEAVTEDLMKRYPQVLSLEMETFHLLDLARCSRGTIRAAAFCIALAERYSNRFLCGERTRELELAGGEAALAALARIKLEYDVSTKPYLNGTIPHVWDYGH